ncbi:MAG TPA: glycosyltransferase family 2 protein [Chitinophagaceae bacterium]|nr:glycosyltransferase family 2 protein [Chitinophagaceae bacterium]
MDLSIIIVNYNTFRLTSNCIQSVYDKLTGIEYDIIIVDNASSECEPESFAEKFPGINLIKSSTNLGFAGGNNLGIKNATGKYILLLNSDTELINNAPGICYNYMQQHPAVGLTTCQLLYPDGKVQYNCRKFRTINWELSEIFPFFRLLPKQKQGQLMLHHYFDHQTAAECDWVWGTFMLFPASILQQFPEKKLADDFFMYGEDILWCWEIKKLGYKITFLPEAKVMHLHKGSTSKNKLNQVKVTGIKNHAALMRKFYPDVRWYLFAAIYYTKQYAALLYTYIFKQQQY